MCTNSIPSSSIPATSSSSTSASSSIPATTSSSSSASSSVPVSNSHATKTIVGRKSLQDVIKASNYVCDELCNIPILLIDDDGVCELVKDYLGEDYFLSLRACMQLPERAMSSPCEQLLLMIDKSPSSVMCIRENQDFDSR
ncbi:hypothetical protein VTP01DRAFT_4943 [Rhizomucor pusillus]|uniref:uncharacterized protein n=1 Tax=Rhizomucor pusillus TaxID=4840 RepID=UPI00374495C3